MTIVYCADNPLHRARVQRGIGLSQLAAVTLLSPRIVDKIDEGRFAELPGGLYARSYIRAFAGAVGLDPDDVIRDLGDRLPCVEDPFPVLREIARAGDPPWMLVLNDLTVKGKAWLAANALPRTGTTRRAVAAVIDAVILLTLQAGLIRVTAWMCDVSPGTLLTFGGGAVAVVWGTLVASYFLLLGGVGGKTPGAYVGQLPVAHGRSPLELPAVLERALLH